MKRKKECEESLRVQWDNNKRSNICTSECQKTPQKTEKESSAERIFEEQQKPSKFGKRRKLQCQEDKQTAKYDQPKKFTARQLYF